VRLDANYQLTVNHEQLTIDELVLKRHRDHIVYGQFLNILFSF